jgi:mannose-6-phosphate isomerase-like protein (cupin superfamily)
MEINDIFYEFSKTFEKKIDREYSIKIQLEIHDMENGIWQIEAKDGKVFVYNEVKIEPEETFTLSKETLFRMYNNEINAYTAFANEPNEKGEMCGLIDMKNKTEDKKGHWFQKPTDEQIKFFSRLHKFEEFFSRDYPNKVIVKNENCRKLHNIDAIALYHDISKNILHAYFSLKKGETLKEPTYDTRIFVLSGKGIIRWGNEKYEINENEYYHINPMIKGTLFIENYEEEPLKILYI